MAELPTCLCVRGLLPYDRLTAIYQAAAELSGDTSLPDALCVAGVPPFQRFSYIYGAFRDLAGGGSLPSQLCVAGESPQDQVSRIYQAVAIYADDAGLQSYECVRGMPIWQQWIEIYRALYLAAGSPAGLVNPACVTIGSLDVLSDVFCAIVGSGGGATLLASFYIPEIVDTFERSQAAGYSGQADADTFQREAAVDVLRSAHYQGGNGNYVILEDDPTECVLVNPQNVEGTSDTDDEFDASWDAIPVTVSLLRYEWRLDGVGSWNPNGTSTTISNEPATAGDHTLDVRAVSTSGVAGLTSTSPTFTVAGTPPLLVDLISYWNMNEASGTRADQHGTNDLTANGAPVGVAGKISNASEFVAASTQFLSHVSNAELQAGDVDWTFAFWFNITVDNTQMLIAKDINTPANSRDYTIEWNAGGTFRMYVNGGAGLVSQGALSTGIWYFAVCWHDAVADTLNIRINDTATQTASTGGVAPQVSAAPFEIGARAFAGFEQYADALVDEVGFWKRKLTAGEITQLYNGGAGVTYPFV